ncbi:MAG: precorrin-6A/cobalt-precorrin-6A reductase [Pseudomonadota bacterium]
MRILLLAGTAEARHLARRLAGQGHRVTASLAGVTEAPLDLGAPTRRGGFGGPTGLAAWIRKEAVAVLIDATHPFARQMPWNAAAASAETAVPILRVIRPEWAQRRGWESFPSLRQALAAAPSGARLLATTGSGETSLFNTRPDLDILLRSIAPVADLKRHVRSVTARPPFSRAEERRLMVAHGTTHLLCRNSGGDPAKLDAAEDLAIKVLMIARPVQPEVPKVDNVEAALDWLRTLREAGE